MSIGLFLRILRLLFLRKTEIWGYLKSGENYGLRPLKLTRSTRLSEMHGRMLSDRVARFGLDAYNMYRYNSTLQNKITELMCTLLMFAHAQNE